MSKPLLSDGDPPRSGKERPKCSVATTLAELDPESAEVLAKWLAATETYHSNALSLHLEGKGIHLSSTTLRRHRRGECSCQH